MINEKIKILSQKLVNQHALSRFMGRLGNCRWRWFKDLMIATFIKIYGVDMQSALESDPKNYPDFNSFFTRALKPGARTIVQGEKQIACPVDGCISQIGKIQAGNIFQAKGFDFDLTHLLGGGVEDGKLFHNGVFTTLYLAPKDYHRIHMPFTGTLKKMVYIPGKLFSVNPMTARNIPQLFARNERVVCIFETSVGPMALILVGAMIVASMETVWAGEVAPNNNNAVQSWQYDNQPIKLNRGEEMGRFKMGSTVIVLFGENQVVWNSQLQAEMEVKLGQWLGTLYE